MGIIDANNMVLGRLASVIAKRLLNGEEIIVVNAEKAIIQGSRSQIIEEFNWRRTVGKQRKGPFYPKRPEMIFKRTVRGMLPHQKTRGREALKRLRVYIGVPQEYREQTPERVEEAAKIPKMAVTLEEISRGWNARF